jgi:hypothetical protein
MELETTIKIKIAEFKIGGGDVGLRLALIDEVLF